VIKCLELKETIWSVKIMILVKEYGFIPGDIRLTAKTTGKLKTA